MEFHLSIEGAVPSQPSLDMRINLMINVAFVPGAHWHVVQLKPSCSGHEALPTTVHQRKKKTRGSG